MEQTLPASAAGTAVARRTNHTINLLRFVFALVIISFHIFNMSGILPDDAAKHFYFFHGNAAVEFFFLVSGFLMAVSAERQIASGAADIGRSSARFILRKIGSLIVPMYTTWVVAFVLYQVFVTDLTVYKVVHNLVRSVYELLFLRNAGFKGYYVMGPTWYISAMLLTMTAAYPLLLKYRNAYLYCIAPLIAAFTLGFLNHEYTSLINTSAYIGVIYKSQIRAVGAINLGVFLFAVYRRFRDLNMTRFGTAVLSLIELLGYAYALYYTCGRTPTGSVENRDVYCIAALSFAVLITFSQRTWLGMLTERFPGLCGRLNTLSLYLYLSHGCICKKIVPIIASHFGTGKKTYCLGMLVVFLMSFFVMLLTGLVKKALPSVRKLLVR